MRTDLVSFNAVRSKDHVPWEISDEVELWAREHGRHGRCVWNPVLRCAEIQLELKADDPRMKGWQEGRLKTKPVESIYLHRQEVRGGPFVAVDLNELGASGVRAWLDRGNMWSGTGEYPNLHTACMAADRHNLELEEKMKAEAVENARLRARDNKRQIFDLPLVHVPADLES